MIIIFLGSNARFSHSRTIRSFFICFCRYSKDVTLAVAAVEMRVPRGAGGAAAGVEVQPGPSELMRRNFLCLGEDVYQCN